MTEQIVFVWVWSRNYPDYTARLAAMSHPSNLHNAAEAANMMFLEPKQ